MRASALLGLLSVALGVTSAPTDNTGLESRQTSNKWVSIFATMQQEVEQNNLVPAPYNSGTSQFKNATLRQTHFITLPAARIRLQISNLFGQTELPITSASIALPYAGRAGVGAIVASSQRRLTFNGGSSSVTIPKGGVAYTDPINYAVKARSNIAISLYLQNGQSGTRISGHPGSRTSSWVQFGNAVTNTNITAAVTKHWYFDSRIEGWLPSTTSTLAILGDSITDGRGSTDDNNDRWPDLLGSRMYANNITNVALANLAAGGNAILGGGLGPYLLSRYKRDAIEQPGVKYVLVFEGVNDLGGSATDTASQTRLGDRLIAAYTQIVKDCKAAGLITIGATITPFGGQGQGYYHPNREVTRLRVNQWILNNGTFDHAVDFASWIGDGDHLKTQFDGGDHLHPNVMGYNEIANRFPLDIFRS